jgi:tetratricopeptide (TPR) repeat protein
VQLGFALRNFSTPTRPDPARIDPRHAQWHLMPSDLHGLPLTTGSAVAAEAFNRSLAGMLDFQSSASDDLAQGLQADPDFCLAHGLHAAMLLQMFQQDVLPLATASLAVARAAAGQATPRERLHLDALDHWLAGDGDFALAAWRTILERHPTDALAMELVVGHHFVRGDAQAMRAHVEGLAPLWPHDLAAHGRLLASRAFAAEECGDFESAERLGRQAVERDPTNLWATHAVAHVLDMQGRVDEGIDWLEHLSHGWSGANNFVHHLWWHLALFRLERGEHDAALELYDTRFRDLASPLTVALPDLYVDAQNAASTLIRLELRGIDVGGRWDELADKAEHRIGDGHSAFTLVHWAMALAATGRDTAFHRFLDGLRGFAAERRDRHDVAAKVVEEVVLPVSMAIAAARRGDHAGAIALFAPLLHRLHGLGGSHVQRDVLIQLALDSATRGGGVDDIERVRAAARRRFPVPVESRSFYRNPVATRPTTASPWAAGAASTVGTPFCNTKGLP